ncbi:hypothetical protein [Sulfitobacter donghicola]|uniref:Uncharacterized protein n=1 Tax=Sulfitobacter donghicola DSW-25 = KCTC 12864 = JCM 14565 TaxID=1300350 RepID=A0A073IKN3_9RHOB|nr:hypothetical protein [Sulfitobacter donghicola]KEJ90329.1 hypothetical protein DSW25_07750 [Sulfitobacter donghicola DSW-25 = KCTC 12864 = JCM 14565]KIN66763.1 hypothetical protein Z948_466 [Sulfitobacter donghicola DSW-25 = KCTC 12864 = JCM 14565]
MNWIFWIIALIALAAVGIALYERRKKRSLLAHDLNLSPRNAPHTEAARIQAEDATARRISGFDR